MKTYVTAIHVCAPHDYGHGPKRYRWEMNLYRVDGTSFGRIVWGVSFADAVRPILTRYRHASWHVDGHEIDSPMRRATKVANREWPASMGGA